MNQGALANFILGGAIALLPLYIRIASVDVGRSSKDNLLLIIMLVVAVILPERERRLPVSLWVFFVYGIFALVINQGSVESINVIMQSFYIVAGMTFFVAYYERHDQHSINYIINGMAIGCVIQSILGIGNYFGISLYGMVLELLNLAPQSTTQAHHVRGSLGNSNLFGSYVAITSMALLRKDWLYALPLALCAIFMSGSIMGIGSMLLGLFYFSRNKFSKLQMYLAAMIGMVAVFLTGPGGHDSGRFNLWSEIFTEVDLKHFVFGMGPGWFANSGFYIGTHHVFQEHNSFISAFNVFGMLGIMLVMSTFYIFLKKKDGNLIFAAALFAAFCNSFGHFTLHQSTVAIIIIVLAAICLAEGNKDEFNL